MTRFARILILITSLSVLGSMPAAAGPDPRALLDGIQRKYRHLPGLKVAYTREVITRSMNLLGTQGDGEKATGHIFFKPPHFLKLIQRTPSLEVVLTNADTLWWYLPEKKKVYLYPADRFGRELRLLSDIFHRPERIEKEFGAVWIGAEGGGTNLIELRPDPPWEEIDRFVLKVGPGYEIRELAIHNILGGLTRFRFGEVGLEPDIPADFFDFEAPAGVEMIREGPQ